MNYPTSPVIMRLRAIALQAAGDSSWDTLQASDAAAAPSPPEAGGAQAGAVQVQAPESRRLQALGLFLRT